MHLTVCDLLLSAAAFTAPRVTELSEGNLVGREVAQRRTSRTGTKGTKRVGGKEEGTS